jgi:hypothetical protein
LKENSFLKSHPLHFFFECFTAPAVKQSFEKKSNQGGKKRKKYVAGFGRLAEKGKMEVAPYTLGF